MKKETKKAKQLFTELRPLFENIDPQLKNIATDDFLTNAIKAQNILGKTNQKKIKQSQEFLDQSKKDLHSSKLLYTNKEFGNSVSMFQQCIEKASKSYGLRTGFIKNAKEIRHESPLVFIKGLKKILIENNMIEMIEKYTGSDEREKITDAEITIKSEKEELTKMTAEQLDTLINLINQLPKLSIDALKTKLQPVEQLVNLFIPNFEQILSTTFLPIKLYVLSIISYKHWQRSHYPDTSILSAKDYNLNMPLVKRLPELHAISEELLKGIDKLLYT